MLMVRVMLVVYWHSGCVMTLSTVTSMGHAGAVRARVSEGLRAQISVSTHNGAAAEGSSLSVQGLHASQGNSQGIQVTSQ